MAIGKHMAVPRVCAVVVTYNRPELLAWLLWCFEQQTWPDKRLLIYDDQGQYESQEQENWRLVSENMRYPTLGEKRNRALELVNGYCSPDLIATWDDDDFYFRHALAAIAKSLAARGDWCRPELVWRVKGDCTLYRARTYALLDKSDRAYHSSWGFAGRLWNSGLLRYPAMVFGEDRELARQLESAGVTSSAPVDRYPPYCVFAPYGTQDRLTDGGRGTEVWARRQKETVRKVSGRLVAIPPDVPWRQYTLGNLRRLRSETRNRQFAKNGWFQEAPASIPSASDRNLQSAPTCELACHSFPRGNRAPLAVVACHFNPCGYRIPVHNLLRFAAQMHRPDVRFYFRELKFEETRPTVTSQCPILQQAGQVLCGGDVLWQQNRLLNLGIQQAIEDGAEAVCWSDSDLIFYAKDWPSRIQEALERHDVVQGFETIDVPALNRGKGGELMSCLRMPDPFTAPAIGYVWAARASVLRDCRGLFDACVVGGNDHATLGGFLRWTPNMMLTHRLYFQKSLQRLRYWQEWAAGVPSGLSLGCAKMRIRSLPHGSFRHREYIKRDVILQHHDFNPYEDLRLGPQGAWLWGSSKPELHQEVREYFARRLEDGDATS